MLLKRHGVKKPNALKSSWTGAYLAWLRGLSAPHCALGASSALVLASFLRQLDALDEEISKLDHNLLELSQTECYRAQVRVLDEMVGVGPLTAMVFLTEIGDPRRFRNRRLAGKPANRRLFRIGAFAARIGQESRPQGPHHAPGIGAVAGRAVSGILGACKPR